MMKIFIRACLFTFLLAVSASAQIDDYSQLFHTTGPNSTSYLGGEMSWCRDVNNDGCDEILVTKRDPEQTRLYYGGSPMDTIPDMFFYDEEGGDGYIVGLAYGDKIVSQAYGSIVIPYSSDYDTAKAYVYHCGPDFDNDYDLVLCGPSGESGQVFGTRICIGNFNGDAFNDIILVDVNFGSGSAGKIFVYYGGPDMDGIVDYTITNQDHIFGPGMLGNSIDCGDVNNDGYDDILATAGTTESNTNVYLFHGGAYPDTIPDWTYTTYDLSTACSIVQGLNGDLYGDVVTGKAWEDVRIFFGGETLSSEPDQIIDYSFTVPFNCGELSDGDLNNDGYDDMIGVANAIDRVHIFHGGPDGAVLDSWIDTPSPRTTIIPGDIDGNGVLDIAHSTYEPNYYGQVFIYGDSTITSVSSQYQQIITSFELLPAYPNPFNAQTTIPFTLDRAGKVRIDVYDVLGRSVGVQYIEPLQAGAHEVIWNAEGVASGVYVVRLTVDPPYGGQQSAETLLHTHTRKVMLVK